MTRLILGGAIAVLSAALATACLGGQTGEPSSGTCGATSLAPNAAWSGTTVDAAARAFQGTYRTALRWRVEPRFASTRTPVPLDDVVELAIAYGDVKASRDCTDELRIPVAVVLKTSASGIADAGEATLTIRPGASPELVGHLHYDSDVVRLDATLSEVAVSSTPRGSFDALEPSLPGASASFGEDP